MTVLEYYQDAYRSSFNAAVVAVTDNNGVVLDRTAFYPGGGGQPHDLGELTWGAGRAPVEKVSYASGRIIHGLEAEPPPVGTAVEGTLDWDRRYALMRTHTALHILCGVIWRDYHRLSTGCDMKPLAAHIDFELDAVDAEMLSHLQNAVVAEIAAGHAIKTYSLVRSEAEQIPDLVRTKINLLPEHLKEIRIVEIVDLDLQADGGTHVANTSEVGDFRLARYKSKGRQNKRLYIELS